MYGEGDGYLIVVTIVVLLLLPLLYYCCCSNTGRKSQCMGRLMVT